MDRDPKKFETILNYLREKNLPELNKAELKSLSVEASYFQLTELEAEITARLDNMEVYKFKCEFDEKGNPGTTQYVTVKKSLFDDVPYYAIVNYFEKGIRNKTIFDKRDFLALDENEMITVKSDISLLRDIHKLDEIVGIQAEILKIIWKMMKTQQVTYNYDGHIFSLSIETACKDPESSFFQFWNDGDSDDLAQFFYFWNNPGNSCISVIFDRRFLCFELDEEYLSANPNASCNGCDPNLTMHTTETRVHNALSKLKTVNNVNEFLQICTGHEMDILRDMGLIGH